MLAYFARRLFACLIILLALSVLAFALVRLVPGDTVTVLLGQRYGEAEAEALRQRMGLDQPLAAQYVRWLSRALRGDFGQTISGRPVTAALAEALPVTGQLMAMALVLATLVGVPLGVAAAARRNRPADYLAALVGLIGLSVPAFWLGAMLILLFSLQLGWLPSGTYAGFGEGPAANLRHMVLPSIALAVAVAAVIMRMTRTSMVEVLGEDYIRTARAKGAGGARTLFLHGLRNGLIPVLTIVGLQAGYLFGGSVVIEEVFSLNGVGRLVLRAVLQRDYPLLQAAILLIGAAFVVFNLLVDLLYAWVDPRMRVRG
ncbi:MAG: ABC transporter permease subunit [Alphaproteobacteria bacterium]|nr:ABC transporter permease subunit [Alphaproteobacteria bacterium]